MGEKPCTFCDIVNGRRPAWVVYQTDKIICFLPKEIEVYMVIYEITSTRGGCAIRMMGVGGWGEGVDPQSTFKRPVPPLAGLEWASFGVGSVEVWEGGWLYSQRMTPGSVAWRM